MGSWRVLSPTAPLLPVNAVLLHTGKVLFFAGSGNDPTNVGTTAASCIWDPSTATFSTPQTPVDASGNPVDIFCAGQSCTADGGVLVAGGTLQYDPFEGLSTAFRFDPISEQWAAAPSMNGGRWYPTQLTLGNGQTLAVSGADATGALNIQPELSPASLSAGDTWSIYPSTSSFFPMYAHMFLLSNGQIFFSGGCMAPNNGVTPRVLTVPNDPTQPIAEMAISSPLSSNVDAGNQAASVLLPPAQRQQVMLMGGLGSASGSMPVNRVAITSDLTAAAPAYVLAPSITHARMHLSAVLLPDRTVFVCNGSSMQEDTATSMLPAEIYTPANNSWTTVEAQTVPRVYHSVALLLPDGRVLTAGGNPQRGVDELRLEVYSPSYMTRKRPVIQSAPASTAYGSSITIQTPQASNVKWVSLIRPSATTHSCDTEQRLVDLPIITKRAGASVTVAVTSNPNLAPPGWYMLFLTDTNSTPSIGAWIHLG